MSKLPQNLTCANCAYSLNGLHPNAPCPECGLVVMNSILRHQALHAAAPEKLKHLSRTALLSAARDSGFLALFYFLGIPHTTTLLAIWAIWAMIFELFISSQLLESQPQHQPRRPWYAREYGSFWCTAMFFALLAGASTAIMSDHGLISGPSLFLYFVFRTAAWACAIASARSLTRQSLTIAGIPLWTLILIQTTAMPVLWSLYIALIFFLGPRPSSPQAALPALVLIAINLIGSLALILACSQPIADPDSTDTADTTASD